MNQNESTEKSIPSFHSLGIDPGFVSFLDKLKFVTPTPIQLKSIPNALEGKDIVGIAQTGTGKTLAFGIPMIQRLSQHKGLGLVLVPTRELALQVDESLFRIGRPFGIKTAVLIGGASMYNQVQALRRRPNIIIATPGRLIDHLNQHTVMLFDVKELVLDEADRMFDMGFAPQIEKILQVIPRNRQTMLFSATMPPKIVKIASTYMNMPISIEVAPQGTTATNITQELYIVGKDFKKELLVKLLHQHTGTILIFTRTKIGAKIITRYLRDMGHKAAEIHSDRSLSQRREALEGFKTGRYRILTATDIASRGIDVKNISVVINYDLPDETENYVHRIGRTARAGTDGRAISIATPDQGKDIKDIERLIRMEIQVSQHPEIVPSQFDYSASSPKGYGRKRFGGGGGRSSGGGYRPRSGGGGSGYGGKPSGGKKFTPKWKKPGFKRVEN